MRIPKHSFILWLAVRNGLATQEKLLYWKHIPPDSCCTFCGLMPDSIEHLFFMCSFSMGVWKVIKNLAGTHDVPNDWAGVLVYLKMMSNKKCVEYSMIRLCLAAVVYHIWRERNRRVFEDCKMGREEIIRRIVGEIRIKILITKWNPTDLDQLRRTWRIPVGCSSDENDDSSIFVDIDDYG